ncbi:hypothetical protein [Piscirickettsia litoralis]|nr:hypothetical protein [Piscirickettsia litoralis]
MRTVEEYTNTIKVRLDCKTKPEVISRATNAGAISYILDGIF